MDEIEKIKLRYEQREANSLVIKKYVNSTFSKWVCKEREKHYKNIIQSVFKNIEVTEVLEIGAGEGGNIPFFKKIGLTYPNIYANELLEKRADNLKKSFPKINHLPGNALDIKNDKKFDIVFQSTVFTSILDDSLKIELANKMLDLTKPNGIILWYDFTYNNPRNKDVKGVKRKEIISLFPNTKEIKYYKVTLAPPIGRRVGKLYPAINTFFPFLRTHLIAVIKK